MAKCKKVRQNMLADEIKEVESVMAAKKSQGLYYTINKEGSR